MIPGERAVGVALIVSVVGIALVYAQVPGVESGDLASLSVEDRGQVARFEGSAVDVHELESGVAFGLVGNGSVRVVCWEPVDVESGDLVSVVGRVDEYREELEVVAEEVEVVEEFGDRKDVDVFRGGEAVSVEGTVDRSLRGGCVLESGLIVEGVEGYPGDVLEGRGVVLDPGLPKVLLLRGGVAGVDRDRVFGSVSEVKAAAYSAERGRVSLVGVVGGARFGWLLYLYDDSEEGFDGRHVNDVLVNELPLRFPEDYVGHVPGPLERVRVTGLVDTYRRNPQVEVENVEPLGTVDAEAVEGTVDRVEGREVVVDGVEFLAAPGLRPEVGDEVSMRTLMGFTHTGERVRVLVD